MLTVRLGRAAHTYRYGIVAALMMLASGLGLLRLGEPEVTLDESVSMRYVHESWAGLWHTVTGWDKNMSVYYAALKLWTGIFGNSVFAVRSLSVVAAVACVPVVYAIGARLFGVLAGLLAAFLLSMNAFFVHYAQEARSYSLVMLLTALSTCFFLGELEQPRRWNRAAYIASSVLAFYAQFFAVWVLFVQVGTLVATRRRAAFTRSWLGCYAAMAALAAPMAYEVVTSHTWGTISWIAKPGWDAIPATYAQLAGGSFLQLGIVIALGLFALRRAAYSERLAFGLAFTAAWAFLPLLAAFALSRSGPAFIAKYLIISLPAMMLLAAGAISCLRRPSLAIAASFLLVALSIPKLLTYYGHG